MRATEGFTAQLKGLRRSVVPVYSLMVATEPIDAEFWDEIGLPAAPDLRRPAPPHHLRAANRRRPHRVRGTRRPVPLRLCRSTGLRPRQRGARGDPEHARRALPSPRDKNSPTPGAVRSGSPATGTLRSASTGMTGIAWAGGYAGDGVATTNLAGRTLRDLILGRDTDIVRLPWVGHRHATGSPSPCAGSASMPALRLASAADRAEEKTGRPSRSGALLERLTGA